MNLRAHALCAVIVCMAIMSACSTVKKARPCSIHYANDVREFGYCDMGPNLARQAFDRGGW